MHCCSSVSLFILEMIKSFCNSVRRQKTRLVRTILSMILVATTLFFYYHSGTFSDNTLALPLFIPSNADSMYLDDQKGFESYCSSAADRRGPHQDVIAITVYGNLSDPYIATRYIEPMNKLIANFSQVYPGWILRIYTQLDNNDFKHSNYKVMQTLIADYSFIDLCNVTRVFELYKIQGPFIQGATWRFLPLMDPLVDRFMSRDCDALITAREVAAVTHWLKNSDATFHLMRDHHWHCGVYVLAGAWGAKIHQQRKRLYDAAYKMFYESKHKLQYGYDQILLREIFWPLTFNNSLTHDSYCCKSPDADLCNPKHHVCIPFTVQRKGHEWVGDTLHGDLVPIKVPVPESCPASCRPADHPDWTHC